MGIQRVKEEMHQVQPPVVIFVASHGTSAITYEGQLMSTWIIRMHKGNCFHENGTFTAPREGIYRFDYHNNHNDSVSNSAQYIDWVLNGNNLGYARIYGYYTGGWENISGHLILELAVNDTIQLRGQAGTRPDGDSYGLWSGYLM